ncbi:hypothetical protein [Tropicimonas sediminicola]|uniref:Uncharacterized protein n=1 Tax=Tropicimonas sediminicola TaxID=1031541 RepID=A0A239EJS1_9RHOB|nr:hypothetical protein [Tropicimonas sediminicola]SNS44528.1 hypothetical protein SAMN05421757_102176 [Tropicimonas sediminicola]
MRSLPFLPLLLAAGPALAEGPGEAGTGIDCYCTDRQGARVELGETICLTVDGRAFLARCEMSLNTPMWRETGDGCVSSQRGPARALLSISPV